MRFDDVGGVRPEGVGPSRDSGRLLKVRWTVVPTVRTYAVLAQWGLKPTIAGCSAPDTTIARPPVELLEALSPSR